MLRENINPTTGEKLTQRNVEGGVRFYDFQCGAEKSVSVLHALTGDERLAVAHDRAAARAFAELESFAACRVRARRCRLVKRHPRHRQRLRGGVPP